MKLIEGEVYPFQVLKKTLIPEEGEFFLLRHQSGRRLLIPEKPYTFYGIEPGTTVNCKVDKVSCTGKVYLEPLHPVYTEGKEYEFDCIGEQAVEGGQVGSILLVKDVFRNTISVLCACNNPYKKEKIRLVVARVRKGIPELYCKGDQIPDELNDLMGQEMVFNIIKVDKMLESDELYILKSQSGYKASLKVKHFSSYGFEVGDTIKCEVYGYTGLGELRVEPENPFYKTGETYEFEIAKTNTYSDKGYDVGSDVLTLIDISGKRCGIKLTERIASEAKSKTRLKCRVVGFRKGKPKLEFID